MFTEKICATKKELIKKIEETEDSKFNSDEDKLFFYSRKWEKTLIRVKK